MEYWAIIKGLDVIAYLKNFNRCQNSEFERMRGGFFNKNKITKI